MSDYIQLPLDFEIWQPIPGYEGLYEASDQGRVRRLPNTPGCKKGRFIAQGAESIGYPRVTLWKNNIGQQFTTHYLVTLAFLGQRPVGCDVNHKNGIKSDNRIENLEYVTRAQNVQHAYDALGHKAVHGERHYHAKLTENNIRQIRQMLKYNTMRAIGSAFGISISEVHKIKTSKTWKHVLD